MTPQNPERIEKIITEISLKFESGKQLSIEEEEMLGLFKIGELKDIHKFDDRYFSNYKFRHLYLTYYTDLSFEGEYFKPNYDKRLSDYIDYKKIQDLNKREFNEKAFNELQDLQINLGLKILIEKSEIKKDKQYLENVTTNWAQEMLNEKHSDQNLALLAKETRDTIGKKNIENFLNNTLSESERIDVRKAILKSKYVHNETLKILEKIGKNEVVYKLDGVSIYYNYGTIIHVLNRHFAQLSSNEITSQSKTFHSTKISPFKLDSILLYIFQKINAKKALAGLVKPDVPFFLKYKNEHYALYLKKDKLNKTKWNINTFYQIDENSNYGANDMAKIRQLKFVSLSSNLGIYKNFS